MTMSHTSISTTCSRLVVHDEVDAPSPWITGGGQVKGIESRKDIPRKFLLRHRLGCVAGKCLTVLGDRQINPPNLAPVPFPFLTEVSP